jgi:hypothetical protein
MWTIRNGWGLEENKINKKRRVTGDKEERRDREKRNMHRITRRG